MEEGKSHLIDLTSCSVSLWRYVWIALGPSAAVVIALYSGTVSFAGVKVAVDLSDARMFGLLVLATVLPAMAAQFYAREIARNARHAQMVPCSPGAFTVRIARSYPRPFSFTVPLLPLAALSIAASYELYSPASAWLLLVLTALPVRLVAPVLDLASLLIDKTDRMGKRLALTDMLVLWSALIPSAGCVFFCLLAVVAAGLSTAPSRAWVDIPVGLSILLQVVAVACFPLVAKMGRAMGYGEPHPAAPLTKAWDAIDRFVSARFRL